MKKAVFAFPIEGNPIDCVKMKNGRIHETYRVTTDTGAEYVLQCINQYVFRNVDAIMNNMRIVGSYLEKQGDGDTVAIRYLPTREGDSYLRNDKGEAWRCYRFVPHSISLLRPETEADLYQCAKAYGRFLHALRDLPAGSLEETIPDFHNTPKRLRQLQNAIEADLLSRCKGAWPEIRFAFSHKEQGCLLQQLCEEGKLPLRVTHNDTKVSNVLLDETNREAVCVIDLDTVMPGLSACDFGDAVRSGAVKAVEEEGEPERVSLDLGLFRAFTRGFLEACPSLTAAEREALPLGAYTMTLELGVRYLIEYLTGDRYFTATDPEQNLRRARGQFRLLRDMEQKWETMQRIARENS